ncbi:Predicted phospholipase, patatin/cPLA2 family [Lentibacillus persicus]|uniref:Predicted phospholipase, patatin/cPLA2 family n=1 Tax=Lentibacillus persicus TaxID=640948 RepID=A0A1I1SIJ9_9BACI|nr:patatin family protein [Lentibacillus persicus]SFD44478.1 Predicted phospholipase, patatin/cPLA2 family [Lentibacillus persicus]
MTDIIFLTSEKGSVETLEYEASLMLEGGGMRCAFTVGVLDFFLDQKIEFPAVATASAGALIGSSYIARQRDRNTNLLAAITKSRGTISIRRLLQKKELFSMDLIFDKLSNQAFPLEFQAFSQSESKFIIGTTDINTGKPEFYDQFNRQMDLSTVIRASCSLPVLAPSIDYKGKQLIDGGVADPIPITPLIEQGFKRHVIVLTRNKDYVKQPTKLNWFYKHMFKDKPNLIKLLRDRHLRYNETMEKIRTMEARNEVFVIQPEKPLEASRIEKSQQKLEALYYQGYQVAQEKHQALLDFLQSAQNQPMLAEGNMTS